MSNYTETMIVCCRLLNRYTDSQIETALRTLADSTEDGAQVLLGSMAKSGALYELVCTAAMAALRTEMEVRRPAGPPAMTSVDIDQNGVSVR